MNTINRFYGHYALKASKLLIIVTGLCISVVPSHGYDFQYSLWDANSSNALDYVVGQVNMQRTSEGGNGVSYWNPINNGQEATLTMEFQFPQPTTSVFLSTTLASYNFGGGDYGSGSLWASTDGANWIQIMNNPTPSGIDSYTWYSSDLPDSLIGSSQIWIQAQLETSGWNIMAQFERSSTQDAFDLDANLIPEPSAALIALSGFALCLVRLITTKKSN
jgi:hypothetical protein